MKYLTEDRIRRIVEDSMKKVLKEVALTILIIVIIQFMKTGMIF